MKKIINGKIYNTDTAEKIGARDNGYLANDFNYCEESLYRKRTGEYFLFGEGGARTRYATQLGGNSWGGGCAVMPLTYESAREWAEKHLTADDYEAAFGPVPEDDGRRNITFSLPAGLVDRIRRDAERSGMSLSAYVEHLLAQK